MIDIEKGTGNVYADLGLLNADEMLVKAQLATKIAEIIKARRLNQTKAGPQVLGLTQPNGHSTGSLKIDLSRILNRPARFLECGINFLARKWPFCLS